MAAIIAEVIVCVYFMNWSSMSAVSLLVGAFGFVISLQLPLFAQVVAYCPGSKFYRYPHNVTPVTPVTPEIPDGGVGMVSASDIRNILNRDPHRINGCVEILVVDGRGGDPKGPYWMTSKDFRCGKFIGV